MRYWNSVLLNEIILFSLQRQKKRFTISNLKQILQTNLGIPQSTFFTQLPIPRDTKGMVVLKVCALGPTVLYCLCQDEKGARL